MSEKKKKSLLFWISLIGALFGGFLLSFSIFTILSSFKVIDKEEMAFWIRLLVYILVSIICGLVRVVIFLLKKGHFDSEKQVQNRKNDYSIKEMIKQAYHEKRYFEVVDIGEAVSDLLWHCGRKKLRISIGSYVEMAANEIKNDYSRSRALIEDIGNTYIEMTENNAIKNAIKYIEKGLKIAEEKNYSFLKARGYRNLSCAYCFRYHNSNNRDSKDLDKAVENIEKGNAAVDEITDPTLKTDAIASLNYAMFRVHQCKGKRNEARECLKAAEAAYTKLSEKPQYASLSRERLKKIMRELGENYLGSGVDEEASEGEAYILNAMTHSEQDRDYSNMFRCAEIYIRFKRDIDKEGIKPVLGSCKRHLNEVPDSDRYKIKYLETIKGLDEDD